MVPVEKPQVTYKIQPSKIGELKDLASSLRKGVALRITEETYSEEEFWLYAEAILNSLVVEFNLVPDVTQERKPVVNYHTSEFNTSNLLNVINEFQSAILNDLETVIFDLEGTPYAHIVDIRWDGGNGIEVICIAGITSGVSANPNLTHQMTWASNSTCDNYALNGQMQNLMYSYWNSQSTFAGKYRPNYLYSPPLWNEGYIPCCWTYTEVETREFDFVKPSDRNLYAVNGIHVQLWHRTVFNASAAPPCLPDVVNSWPITLVRHANGTAFTGISSNPNPYHHQMQPNGLVLIGFAITPKNSAAANLNGIAPVHPEQTEHWHKVTFTYGRQIPTNTSNS